MHPTAMSNCELFFNAYADSFPDSAETMVIEIGSQDVNGSLRSVVPANYDYLGVDFVDGKGVDIVLDDPYELPFGDESADVILSSSCFEHSEMFWLVFLEIMRVLKPGGLFYLNVPSNGVFHRHPVDCWRFYPDSGNALVTWARRNNINATLLESYISNQREDVWNDFVAVFLKDESQAGNFKKRIVDTFKDMRNGLKNGKEPFLNESVTPEDQIKLNVIQQIITNEVKIG